MWLQRGRSRRFPTGARRAVSYFTSSTSAPQVSIQIVPLGGALFQFKATGSKVNLRGLLSPTTISVTVQNPNGISSTPTTVGILIMGRSDEGFKRSGKWTLWRDNV